jgi:hypothetical protein
MKEPGATGASFGLLAAGSANIFITDEATARYTLEHAHDR